MAKFTKFYVNVNQFIYQYPIVFIMTMNLSDILKSTTSITEVAKKLDCSRPTLYRYIDLYEKGDKQLPQNIKLYFDAIMTEGISRAESEVYLESLKKEWENTQMNISTTQVQIKELSQKIITLKKALSKDPNDSIMENELKMQEMQLMTLETMLREYEERLQTLKMERNKTVHFVEKAVKESRESGPDWIDAEIRHVCSGTTGNFIIIYEKPDSDSEVYVELYARISGDDVCLGRYIPEQGKNFVQISGLPNTLSYSYKIVLFDDDGKHCTGIMRLNTR